jgi:hypothetical protein
MTPAGRKRRKAAVRAARRFAGLVYRRDRGVCRYCSRPVVFLHQLGLPWRPVRCGVAEVDLAPDWTVTILVASLDHVRERDEGGGSGPGNLALSCVSCNQDKAKRKHAGWWSASED